MHSVGDVPLELLRDKICRVIRDWVLRGAVKPGEQLVEATIAKELNVSRTALREAFWLLEKQGYVRIVPREGAFVTALSPEEIAEIYELRIALEPLAASYAQRNLRTQDKVELRRIFHAMQQCASKGDRFGYYENDRRFHESIWARGGNGKLQEVLTSICPVLFTFLACSPELNKARRKALEIHENILVILDSNSSAKVERLIRESIQGLGQLTLGVFEATRR